ncbi:MAG: T9SS type B sorting domain-containing protein [Paludibacteraceae bacterium]|nr:T9SS type B sorting domain-containing protein [Paludibacteraceae bacterium]
MKNFIKIIRCLTTATFLQFSATVFSQSWNLVWQEDFGVVPDSVYSDFADPSKTMPGHKCAKQGQAVQDGFYAIVSHVYNEPMGSWWYEIDDHTGNKDGGLLLCNTDGSLEGEIIYKQKIEFPICSTNKYKFVMYAGGSTNFGGILPSLEMTVLASDGSLLGQTKTGGIPMLYSSYDWSVPPTWSKYEVEFDPGNYEWVEFQLINRAECTAEGETPGTKWDDECQCNKISCGSGNDFVLDDIQLFRQDAEMVPDPDITNNSLVEETNQNGCLYSSSYSIPSKVLDDWHQLYKNIYFLWQESEDGYTWNDIAEPISGIDKTKTVLDVDATKSMQYRVIITGADESEAKAKEIAKQISKNGGPDDGCYLFSISNTLSAALPKPDCKYRKNLRILWSEDFGVCDTMELKTHPNAPGTFYEDDGVAEFDAGKYVITSCPSLAIIQSKSWNVNPERDSKNAKDSKGKVGGAFLYGKTSVTDTVIYLTDFAGPFCNCKAYMLNVDVFKNVDWGTLPIRIEVLDGKDVIGEASGIIPGGQGGWITLSAPFQLPSDFKKSLTLKISCSTKYIDGNKQIKDAEKNVSFGIDNITVAVCGETMPETSVYIDGDKSLQFLSGFDCTDEKTHTIDFDGKADWIDQYPDAAFIWQTSVDGGATWSNLSASSTSVDYEYTGNLETLYRVVIGETETVAEEVAATGRHKDECSVYYITNVVGFKCKESECHAPKFSFDADKEVKKIDTVFCATPDAIDINVIQTNKANVDDFYIAIMGADKKYEAAKVMSPAPTSTDNIWKISLDKKSANYMIYAINDTCKSDTLYINVDVREPIKLKPVDDQMFCGTEKPVVEMELASGNAESILLKYGSHEGKAEVVLMKSEVKFADIASKVGDVDVTAYAISKDGKCKSEEIIFHVDYEDEPDFTFNANTNIVCKSEKAELDLKITPTHNSKNHVYEIKGSDGSTVDIDDLVVFPTEKTTYTATATSEVCKSNKSEDVEIDVELPQAIDLSTVPSPVLQTTATGSIVCAPTTVSFTVSGDNLMTWDWEYRKKGENDFSKWDAGSTQTTNDFEITEETSFRVSSAVASTNVCKAAYSDIITIEAENKPVFSLILDKDRVCENGDVELTLVTNETYDPSQITATANGNAITLKNNKYTTAITETTKFEVTVSGKVCAETKFDTTVYVDHPLSFTLSADKTKICEGEDVTFTVTGESNGIVWYKSTDGNKYTEFTPESGNKITPDETIYVYAGTPSDGACGAFKVDPIKIEVEKPISFDLTSDVNGKICAGTEVNFAVRNLVGTPNSSKWEKNDIEINAVSSYKDTPVSTSTYKVTLNGDVCPSVEQKIEIEVESADALTLTADKSLICEGESVTLTKDYGTNDPASVTWWSETDGMKTKISEISTVAPNKSTSYYLSVKGSVCDEVYSQPAIVEVEPKIDFELKSDVKDLVCEGTEVTLELDLKSGNPENVTFTANGDPDPYDIVKKKAYKVTPAEETKYELTLQGSACSAETKSVNIRIQKQPKLSVSIDKTAVCEGEDVTIIPTAENVDDLIWKSSEDGGVTFNDDPGTLQRHTYNLTKTTIVSVTTKSDNACEQVVWTQEVEVEPAFSVSFDNNTTILCPNEEVEIKASVDGMNDNLKFEWTKSIDGAKFSVVGPTNDPTIVKAKLDTTTIFTVKVSGKYCESQSDTTTATIDLIPTLTLEASADSICEGEEVTLNAIFSSNNYLKDSVYIGFGSRGPSEWEKESWHWAGIGGITEYPKPSRDVDYILGGFTNQIESLEYKAQAQTPAGCKINPVTKRIFVEKAISLNVPSDTSLCEGGEVKLSVDGSKGYQYIWTIDGDTVSKNYKFTYDGDEPANVKLESKSSICSESYDFAINVVPTPHIVSVEESGANAFEVAAEGGSGAYLFDFGDGYQPSSTLSPATYGRTYKVKVKDELGCESDTTIKTPTYELEFPVSFTPNGDGENDVWEINNIDKYPGATVKIFDRFGKKLCDMKAAEMDSWDGTYNGRALPSTDYWYEIQIDEIDKTYIGHFTLIRN